MMNNARLSVGIQGLAIAERAYQQAAAFAKTRVQSKDDGSAEAASRCRSSITPTCGAC